MPRLCFPSLDVEFVSGRLNTVIVSPMLIEIVYVFIGSVIVGDKWFRIAPGSIVGIIGIAYIVLEFIPSIEPPANMRYVRHDNMTEFEAHLVQ